MKSWRLSNTGVRGQKRLRGEVSKSRFDSRYCRRVCRGALIDKRLNLRALHTTHARDTLDSSHLYGSPQGVELLIGAPVFAARDFAELPNGVCRIAAPLTHELALTLPHWRELLRPIAASLARTFRDALASKNGRSAIPASKRSPLAATPRNASRPRLYAAKAGRAPRPEALAANPIACASCGEPILKRRRRYCEACLPQARRERGLQAIAVAPKALAAQAAAGKDPRASAHAGRRRGDANAEHHRRNHRWARELQSNGRDRAWFEREVVPKLAVYPLNALARATGLSLAACSRIRAGAQAPHPRHWGGLLALVKAGD